MTPASFYSNGKLLLTGEYLVLDGAQALAIPTQRGQALTVEKTTQKGIHWKSLDCKGNIWLDFNIEYKEIQTFSKQANLTPRERLVQLLYSAQQLNKNFLSIQHGLSITTKLDFAQDWGLGSSSTLISNLAYWAQVDPYLLLQMTFTGSGYDLACARSSRPLIYQLKNKNPLVKMVPFNPPFEEHLYFIHLNQKQNSRDAIAHYRKQEKSKLTSAIQKVSNITQELITCTNLSDFKELIDHHEQILSNLLNIPTIKSQLFNEYSGSIKSLGGWGGDFILVTGSEEEITYFKNKGYHTCIPFKEMKL